MNKIAYNRGPLNEKNHWPPLEELKVGQKYAITMSPRNQYFLEGSDRARLQKFYIGIKELVNRYLKGSYTMYLELSTKSVNYHYHGEIMFSSEMEIVHFYLGLPELTRSTTLVMKELFKTESGEEGDQIWSIYCQKQKRLIEPFCIKNYTPYILKSDGKDGATELRDLEHKYHQRTMKELRSRKIKVNPLDSMV